MPQRTAPYDGPAMTEDEYEGVCEGVRLLREVYNLSTLMKSYSETIAKAAVLRDERLLRLHETGVPVSTLRLAVGADLTTDRRVSKSWIEQMLTRARKRQAADQRG